METGNLTSRKNVLRNLTENFTYNNLDQLTSWQVGGTTYSIGYQTDGTSRINTKTDAGTYVYGVTPNIHQVTGVYNNPGTLNNTNANITYNSFNKIASINETGAYRQEFTYAADEQRRVSKLYNSSSVLKKETVYVPGGYEVEKRGSNTRRLHYIPVGDCWALYTKNSAGSDSLYFILTDHLGSAHIITSSTGTVLKEMSFDPWGRRRNPNDWTYNNVPVVTITSRGFTMHEHMDAFKLINMNGRVYDPVLGQFLSPDPFVDNTIFTSSYNRYLYCSGNPLKYVDPSGYQKTTKGMDHVMIVNTWGLREHSPFGPNRNSGGRGNGPYWTAGSPYKYNEYTDTYTNAEGQTVSYWEVYHNYIKPNSIDVTDIMLPILKINYAINNNLIPSDDSDLLACLPSGDGDPTGVLSNPYIQPGDQFWMEFNMAAGAFARNYRDMRKANTIGADKYFHCKANFEAASFGPGGLFFAEHFSNLREIWDQNIKGYPRLDSVSDQEANQWGRDQVGEALNSCKACQKFRPAGLPDKY